MALELEQVRAIAERVAASYGLEVFDLELRGGGKARTLRIFLDRSGSGEANAGVTLEDCANVSREMSTILDVEEAVGGGSYTLEVSSPGLDRKLFREADYVRFVGSRIKLMTYEPVNGNRHFEGRLQTFADGKLLLDTTPVSKNKKKAKKQPEAPSEVEIAFGNIEKANLVPEI
jgi:ribosome maturation factor RimP